MRWDRIRLLPILPSCSSLQTENLNTFTVLLLVLLALYPGEQDRLYQLFAFVFTFHALSLLFLSLASTGPPCTLTLAMTQRIMPLGRVSLTHT